MSVFCILWGKPGPALRLVITIVIYLAVIRFAPDAGTPLVIGGTLGAVLTVTPRTTLRPAGESPERAR